VTVVRWPHSDTTEADPPHGVAFRQLDGLRKIGNAHILGESDPGLKALTDSAWDEPALFEAGHPESFKLTAVGHKRSLIAATYLDHPDTKLSDWVGRLDDQQTQILRLK
jgi:hypothetical protein